MKGPVVFDFDKTLTDKDTLVGFYRESSSGFMFRLKYPVLLISAILFKTGIISNDTLKRIGVGLFLKGYKKSDLQKIASRYSSKIKLNNIYHNEFLKYSPERVIIISASFEDYLKPLFPDYKVIGSTLKYDGSTLVGLSVNMYAERKKYWLNEQNIDRVDIFYTDSFTDRPVMDISNDVYLVEDGQKRKLNNVTNTQ